MLFTSRRATQARKGQQLAHDFDRVAPRYDLLQRLNPGYHADLMLSAKRLQAPALGCILDLCCGTGLSTEALVAAYPEAEITAVDQSAGMLEVARRKPALSRVRFIQGDAMNLAACGADGPYDAILMAYGIRNMTDPDRCLAYLREHLSPHGRIAFHEYLVRDAMVPRLIWNAVAATLIVPLGTVATGSSELFRYLRNSVNDFDRLETFEERLRKAGFQAVHHESMDGWQRGIVHTVLATR
jgi:ubiquinone/menaquinone biosynthesis methyltransferase